MQKDHCIQNLNMHPIWLEQIGGGDPSQSIDPKKTHTIDVLETFDKGVSAKFLGNVMETLDIAVHAKRSLYM